MTRAQKLQRHWERNKPLVINQRVTLKRTDSPVTTTVRILDVVNKSQPNETKFQIITSGEWLIVNEARPWMVKTIHKS